MNPETKLFRCQMFCKWTRAGKYGLKLKLIYDRRSIGQSVLVSGSHLEPMTRFLFSVWRLRVSWCVTPSLTRGRVCNLLVQLLLGLARAVTLGPKSRITVSSETPPTWRARSPYLYPLGTGWPSYTPGHWVPFCRLLRLAGKRWKYSNPPPHGEERVLLYHRVQEFSLYLTGNSFRLRYRTNPVTEDQ
jgi:hypothetical protein